MMISASLSPLFGPWEPYGSGEPYGSVVCWTPMEDSPLDRGLFIKAFNLAQALAKSNRFGQDFGRFLQGLRGR